MKKIMKDLTRIIPDKQYLKILYYYKFRKMLNLKNPKTFNEKLQWLKLYDRNTKYIELVDKYLVKKYIENEIGKEYIIPTICVCDNFDEIEFDKLPEQFVIKCNHDSGGVIICKDKKNFNINEAKMKIERIMKTNFYFSGREWPYKNIKRKIIVEKYMEDKVSKELIDYKVMCFNGKPEITFTCTERFNDGLKVTFFDNNWKKINFERHYPSSNKDIKCPKNFDKMLELSKKLSKKIPFVRVDWYEINGKLYFGELTFYPGSGYEEFTPEEWDYKLGEMLILPNNKIK